MWIRVYLCASLGGEVRAHDHMWLFLCLLLCRFWCQRLSPRLCKIRLFFSQQMKRNWICTISLVRQSQNKSGDKIHIPYTDPRFINVRKIDAQEWTARLMSGRLWTSRPISLDQVSRLTADVASERITGRKCEDDYDCSDLSSRHQLRGWTSTLAKWGNAWRPW